MTLGRLLYFAYHRPRERLEATLDTMLFVRRDRAMRAAAARLAPSDSPLATDLPSVRFLTGARFAHQTVFCAHSFCRTTGVRPRFEFFDDGTLSAAQAELLLRVFPSSTVIPAAESLAAVERHLPADRFPALRRARACSPLMRKLLDLHAGRRSPVLYLDSDMLFFACPDELLAWLRNPEGALHMTEAGNGAYVDDPATLALLFGRVPVPVNTGIVALDDTLIDWPALERAGAALDLTRRVHEWAEQTLFAWLLGNLDSQPLNRARYRVCTSRADLTGPQPVLRHYVHKAKMPYVAGAWRGIRP